MTSAPTLYIFPHVGGSASFYVPFSKAFSTDIKRIAVQYPGANNGNRAVPSIHQLADHLYRLLAAAPHGPAAFFGHSMGALVAFEVARRFESEDGHVAVLFVSGSTAPGLMRREYFRDLSDDEMMRFLVGLSGMDPKVLNNKDFIDMMLPSLRGYYNSIAGYSCPPGSTVSCPIYAFVGTHDPLAPYDNVAAWSAHTTSEFAVRVFAGDHFYFTGHLPEVVNDIETRFFDLCKKRG
jgi:surfactin synthase thioesterase subunit